MRSQQFEFDFLWAKGGDLEAKKKEWAREVKSVSMREREGGVEIAL